MTRIDDSPGPLFRGGPSWVVVCRTSGRAIMETWNANTADQIRRDQAKYYTVRPIAEHLQSINAKQSNPS